MPSPRRETAKPKLQAPAGAKTPRKRYGPSMVFGGLAGLLLYVLARLTALPEGVEATSDFFVEALTEISLWKLLLVGTGVGVGAWLASGKWTPMGVLLYMSLTATVFGFILYSATVSLPRNFTLLNLLLFIAECLSLGFVVIYAYYTIDRTSRTVWNRHYLNQPRRIQRFPKVEFHVPMFNEPPHVVLEVLDHLLRVDYPRDRYTIVVADDSTDEQVRGEIERFCREHPDRIRYIHRVKRGGFKAGALNHALRFTPPDVELLAVIDADYKVEPQYLKETVGYFEENPELGFLQTPQDFHNVDYSPFTEQIYRANKYFYDAIMPARNEVNSIIFCGTMGIVRKRALEEAGGWGEDTLTEDSETSVRIMAKGWESLYVPRVYGRGLLPQSYSAYKSQQYRWAFGGAQILRKHAITAVKSGLSLRQRWDLVTGGLHYFSGTILCVIAFILLIMGLGEIYDLRGFVNFHKGEIMFMGFVPFFIMLEGILRMRWAMGKAMGLTMRETFQVMGVWFSQMFFTTYAALKAFAGSNEGFVRTPKYRSRKVSSAMAWYRAIRLMKFEATVAWLLLVTGVGVLLTNLMNLEYIWAEGLYATVSAFVLAFWLIWYAYVFGCGPIYAARGSKGPA
ncbi:MAG TPA: glycosyltransferase [Candidatus Thermoplasmatota archaeon]|nr:glycosyltransferase [Candidatus Thermoplasmatota archaeon]